MKRIILNSQQNYYKGSFQVIEFVSKKYPHIIPPSLLFKLKNVWDCLESGEIARLKYLAIAVNDAEAEWDEDESNSADEYIIEDEARRLADAIKSIINSYD